MSLKKINSVKGEAPAPKATPSKLKVVAKAGDGNFIQKTMGAINERGQTRLDALKQAEKESVPFVQNPLLTAAGNEAKGAIKGLDDLRRLPAPLRAIAVAKALPGMPKELALSIATSIAHPLSSFGKPIEHLGNLSMVAGGVAQGSKALGKTKLGQGVKSGAANAVSNIESVTTGVKPDITHRWITKTKDVFTKENMAPTAYSRVGKNVQEVTRDTGRIYAAKVAQEKAALDGVKEIVPVDDIVKNTADDISKITYTTNGESRGLSLAEIKKINEYVGDLQVPRSPLDLHKIKVAIDNEIAYGKAGGLGAPISDKGQQILFGIRDGINQKLRVLSSPYAEANDAMHDFLKAQQVLNTKLTNVKVGANMKSAMADVDLRNALKTLAESMPAKQQGWYEDLLNVEAAQAGQGLFRQGGGIIGNIGAGAAANFFSPSLAVPAALATSPKFASLLNRGAAGISGGAQAGLAGAAKLPLAEILAARLATSNKK